MKVFRRYSDHVIKKFHNYKLSLIQNFDRKYFENGKVTFETFYFNMRVIKTLQ